MKLNNYQYDRLLQQFDEKRMNARYELEQREEEIYTKLPRIKEIDEAIASESVAAGKKALMGDSAALDALKEKIRTLTEEKAALLTGAGYAADYLQEKYECEKCRDTGFIGTEPCGCFKTAMTELIFEESNIKDIIDRENFSTFNLDLYSDTAESYDKDLQATPYKHMKGVLEKVKGFIQTFDKEHRNLLIYGNTGLGKTFLSNCIASEILNSGHTVMYYTTFELFDMLSKYHFRYEDYPKETFSYREGILTCELLIIDDLGTELTSAFTTTQLYSIINERLINGLSTLISTNLSPAQISGRYGERIFSRISKDYDFIKLIGEDIRTKL